MHLVVHFEDLLLLCSKWSTCCIICLIAVPLIHHGEAHWAWNKDVVALWWVYLWLHIAILCLDALKMIVWLVAIIICHISTWVLRDCIFLVMAVEFLDVEALSSLIVVERSARTWLKRSICPCSSLCMQMLSQICVWWPELIHYARSVLNLNASLGSVHMVYVVLLLESLLSILLILEDLGKDAFSVTWVNGVHLTVATATILER